MNKFILGTVSPPKSLLGSCCRSQSCYVSVTSVLRQCYVRSYVSVTSVLRQCYVSVTSVFFKDHVHDQGSHNAIKEIEKAESKRKRCLFSYKINLTTKLTVYYYW